MTFTYMTAEGNDNQVDISSVKFDADLVVTMYADSMTQTKRASWHFHRDLIKAWADVQEMVNVRLGYIGSKKGRHYKLLSIQEVFQDKKHAFRFGVKPDFGTTYRTSGGFTLEYKIPARDFWKLKKEDGTLINLPEKYPLILLDSEVEIVNKAFEEAFKYHFEEKREKPKDMLF